jgi:NAD(P)-dependent dehydrogenase (short-subunit alcohol dehydrogenase family)
MSAVYPSLVGRGVVITGGATGIGAALVRAFVGQGSQVAFLDVAQAEGGALAAEVGAHFERCDLSDLDALRTAMARCDRAVGRTRVLVNNAAWDERHTLAELDGALWDRLQSVNLRPHAFTAQAVAPGMVAAGGGSIINLSSNAWRLGLAGYPGYIAAKAGIVGLTKALARELGPGRIRVNAVLPGWVMTARQKARWVTPQALAETLAAQCIGEAVSPDDVAAVVLFLAADGSRLMTAQSLIVDGGRA